ncbi:MAG: class I SAM-dependent methyltransferase [Bdellovibrio sp.]
MKIKPLIRKIMLKFFGPTGFGKVLVSADQSHTYGVFCEKVYGRNLSQCNMVDEEQLQKLLSILNLNSSHSVLDLGCGIGRISEYISDVTGAKVTGIDFAAKAISSAQKRTIKKRDRVSFVVGDLNSLPDIIEKFDCVIAIDSLYFVNNLDKTINQLVPLLKNNGQFAAFFTQKWESTHTISKKLAEETKLAKALSKLNIKFQTWNFTSNEKKIWELSMKTAEELKDGFKLEKKMDLYKGRFQESVRNLEWSKQSLTSRWLFHAVKTRLCKM